MAKPQFLTMLVVTSGALLFLPDAARTALGLEQVLGTIKPWVGGALVLGSSGLAVHGLSLLLRTTGIRRKSKKVDRQRRDVLNHLTPGE